MQSNVVFVHYSPSDPNKHFQCHVEHFRDLNGLGSFSHRNTAQFKEECRKLPKVRLFG